MSTFAFVASTYFVLSAALLVAFALCVGYYGQLREIREALGADNDTPFINVLEIVKDAVRNVNALEGLYFAHRNAEKERKEGEAKLRKVKDQAARRLGEVVTGVEEAMDLLNSAE